jgi:hypothetical protein
MSSQPDSMNRMLRRAALKFMEHEERLINIGDLKQIFEKLKVYSYIERVNNYIALVLGYVLNGTFYIVATYDSLAKRTTCEFCLDGYSTVLVRTFSNRELMDDQVRDLIEERLEAYFREPNIPLTTIVDKAEIQ